MFVVCVLVGRAKVLIARSIARVVRDAFVLMCRQTPTKSSMYPSTHPYRGRLRATSAGRAGANGVVCGRRVGLGIESGGGCVACVCDGSQYGLLMMSLPRSVRSSISTHHSAGLKEPPNVRRRYTSAHIVVEHMHFVAVLALRCMRLYADARSNLQSRMCMFG